MSQGALDISQALLWTIVGLWGLAVGVTLLCLWSVAKKGASCWREDGIFMVLTVNTAIAVISRLCLIVIIPMLFHRINQTWNLTQQNMLMITAYEPFSAYNTQCGDELNALNTTKASDFMKASQQTTNQSYWYTFSAIILLCLEWAAFFTLCICGRCCNNDCFESCFKKGAPSVEKVGSPEETINAGQANNYSANYDGGRTPGQLAEEALIANDEDNLQTYSRPLVGEPVQT